MVDGTQGNNVQLPSFVKARTPVGVGELLQRLVYFPDWQGLARSESAVDFEHLNSDEMVSLIREAEEMSATLGIKFKLLGAD